MNHRRSVTSSCDLLVTELQSSLGGIGVVPKVLPWAGVAQILTALHDTRCLD